MVSKFYIVIATIASITFASAIIAVFAIASLSNNSSGLNKTTNIANLNETPKMVIMILKDNADHSNSTAEFEANNTQPIIITTGTHIRFDSVDHRTPETINVIAQQLSNTNNGKIFVLRKAYDVNNEYFVNLQEGHYTLKVAAEWIEIGSRNYDFDIIVTDPTLQ